MPRRTLFVLMGVLTSLALVGCQWNPFHKVYTATAIIKIVPRHITEITSHFDFDNESDHDFASEVEIMESPDVLMPVIKDLKLDQTWAQRFKSPQNVLTPLQALSHLCKVLRIENMHGTTSTIISITSQSEVPRESADIANAVADHYKTLRDIEEARRAARGIDALRNQIAQQQKIVADETSELIRTPEFVNNDSILADIAQMEGDVDKLLKNGFSEDHPRVQALREEIERSRQEYKDTVAASQRSSQRHREVTQELESQKNVLDAYNIRLKQAIANRPFIPSPVLNTSRAVPPK